jgi:hypothetical protein
MKKEDFLKLGLTEEQATKAAEASAEELKGFIPKSRFDEVNDTKKKLEEDIKTRDTQLEELKKVDAAGLQQKITDLQNENKIAKEKFDADLKKLQIDNAVEKALIGAKSKNVKAVKALLDLEKAELDGETIKGLDDQLKKLKEGEDTKFLFESESTKPNFKGIKPADKSDKSSGEKPKTLADAVKMHFESTQ